MDKDTLEKIKKHRSNEKKNLYSGSIIIEEEWELE